MKRQVRLAALALLAMLLVPARGAAPQQSLDAFAEALVAFTVATLGSYGDEGPHVLAALAAMERALGVWEADARRLEAAAHAADAPAGHRAARHRALAAAYLRAGRVTDAVATLDAAVELDPAEPSLHMLRGVVLAAAGSPPDAARAFARAQRLAGADAAAAYTVWIHRADLDEEDAARAMDVLRPASRVRGDDPTVRPFPPFPVHTLLPQRTTDLPLPPMAAYVDGYRRLARGELREALADFRAVAARDPLVQGRAVEDARVRQGLAAFRAGQLTEAQRQLTAALDRPEIAPETRRMLGLAYLADYQYDEGIRHLEAAVAAAPGDERPRLALARAFVQAGRLPEAEAVLRATAARVPDSVLARWWLGTVLLDLNRDHEARQAFEAAQAMPVVSGGMQLQAVLTSLARNEGDYAAAITTLLARVRANPNDLPSHLELAHAYLQVDRHDDAFAEYVAALLIEPGSAVAHAGIGQLHLAGERYDEAVAALSRGLAIDPAMPEARYALALALARLGRAEDAAREMRAYQQLQGEATEMRRRRLSLDVLAEEAASWTLQGDHDRAAALWARIVGEEPGDAAHRAKYAAALEAAGRLDDAVAEYEQAVALGADAQVYRALADLLARAGRPEASAAARVQYERAILRLFGGAGGAR